MCRRSRPCSTCSRHLIGSYIRSRGRVSARGNKDRTLYSSHHAVKKPPRATRQWQLRLPPLVRRIALLTKVFGVLHHFHDVNGGRGTHSRASSCRTGTYRHHAGHGDCSRNNGRRENDEDFAHLSLLSETLVQPGFRVPPPPALLGQRSGNKTVNCDQLFLAPKDFFESCSKGPVERCNS